VASNYVGGLRDDALGKCHIVICVVLVVIARRKEANAPDLIDQPPVFNRPARPPAPRLGFLPAYIPVVLPPRITDHVGANLIQHVEDEVLASGDPCPMLVKDAREV
jgi:hypothetical protein